MDNEYIKSTHRYGRRSTIILIFLILMVPAVITIVNRQDVTINVGMTINAIITLTAIYGPVSLIEVVSYSPVLGIGGTYLSFITGNIMNMKLPAAENAMRVNNVERGTDEGEVVGTLAIGASALTVTAILFLGMLFLGRLLVPVLTSEAMAPAFNNIMPALLGALAFPAFLKDIKLAVIAVGGGVMVYLIVGLEAMASISSFIMLPFLIVIFCIYLLMYKFGIIKETGPADKTSK